MGKEQVKLSCPANPQTVAYRNIQNELPTTDPLHSLSGSFPSRCLLLSACSTLTTFPNYSGLPISPFITTQNFKFFFFLSAFIPSHHISFLSATFLSIISALNPALSISLPLRLFYFPLTWFIFSLLTLWYTFHTPQHYKWTKQMKERTKGTNEWMPACMQPKLFNLAFKTERAHQPHQPSSLFSHFRPLHSTSLHHPAVTLFHDDPIRIQYSFLYGALLWQAIFHTKVVMWF